MGKIILLSSKVVWNAATAGPHPGIVDAINAVAAASLGEDDRPRPTMKR